MRSKNIEVSEIDSGNLYHQSLNFENIILRATSNNAR